MLIGSQQNQSLLMDLNAIRQLADSDMQAVNQLIYKQLESDVALINQLGFYIINGGGKRLRPLLSILAARAIDYKGDSHLKLAAIIEFIHTASLLHDDVVDESTLRRGRKTANALFGNSASVLVGDFLYTRSFQMMTELKCLDVLEILADATNVLAEGEVLQLMNCNDPDTTEDSYMRVIYCKTAKLFEAATRLAGLLADSPIEVQDALADYGKYLGTAFQLTDDLLDYTAETEELGKNIGDDLAEGKPTLPLIFAMANGSDTEKALIREAIEKGDGTEHIEIILSALKSCGALEYTEKRAIEESDKAIAALDIIPDSDYKTALISLAKIATQRSH
ncbi:octaprenyl-diphosphate synthase IspB [Shewanella sp. MBTL60-007]|nr:octaprenyl-diphosphate synthase IspB [Shewanella sp. MBTL60-007]